MTLKDIHALLCSRSYYEVTGDKYFRFSGNSMFIDRRAALAFALQEENGHFYLGVMPQVDDKEPLLRIETDNPDGRAFHFYGKESGREILVLE